MHMQPARMQRGYTQQFQDLKITYNADGTTADRSSSLKTPPGAGPIYGHEHTSHN